MPVVIVDYGMGNLFSVKQGCEQAGMTAVISGSRDDLLAAPAAILPGVGAFGVAMENLGRLDLVSPLRDFAASGRPLLGICLGMQLLMTESAEFGSHKGLGVFQGEVVRLETGRVAGRGPKVPQVGWNRIHAARPWRGSLLDGLDDGEFVYFVHSFYCRAADAGLTLATTTYGPITFCSAIARDSIFACQFHPERSGPRGLRVYGNLAAALGGPRATDRAEARRC